MKAGPAADSSVADSSVVVSVVENQLSFACCVAGIIMHTHSLSNNETYCSLSQLDNMDSHTLIN